MRVPGLFFGGPDCPPPPLVVPDVFFQSLSGTRIRSSRHSGVPDDKVFRTSGTQNGWPERLRALFLPELPPQMSFGTSEAAKNRQNGSTALKGGGALMLYHLICRCLPATATVCPVREVERARRRAAADIKGNGYRGARGKGCSVRTAGVCLSAGAPSPARVSRTNPFPRPRPPFPAMEPPPSVCRTPYAAFNWSRRPPSARPLYFPSFFTMFVTMNPEPSMIVSP